MGILVLVATSIKYYSLFTINYSLSSKNLRKSSNYER